MGPTRLLRGRRSFNPGELGVHRAIPVPTMARSLFNRMWRLMLVFSLAVGPWPPAAWAVFTPAAADRGEMRDCHDSDAAPEATTPLSASCEDGCCPDPACDPSHCLVLHASIATVPAVAADAVPTPAVVPQARPRARPDAPRRSLLRPPIA